MAQITIVINSREYAVACEDGQEARLLQLSRLLDEKAKLLTGGGQQVNENLLLAMVGLLLADELTELKKGQPALAANPDALDRTQVLNAEKQVSLKLFDIAERIKKLANKIESL